MPESIAALPPILGAIWFTVVGAAVGSFLNVVIARVPAGLSVVRPASRCPRCGAGIAWYDNVPVLSWLALRGRCRGCAAPISVRYPLVELLGAGAGWLAFHRHGLSAEAGAELVFVAALLALAFIDLDTWLLPYALTLPVIAGGLAAAALGWAPADGFRASAIGAAAGFAAFGAIAWGGERLLGKEALGWGDVWLLCGLGAWLGPLALLPVVLLASVQGSVVGIGLVLTGRAQRGPAPDEDGAAAASAASAAGAPPPARDAGDREGEGEGDVAAPPDAGAPPARDAPPALPAPTDVAAPAPVAAPEAEEDGWVPPRNAVPFGPFLVLGTLQWLYLSAPLAEVFPALRAFR